MKNEFPIDISNYHLNDVIKKKHETPKVPAQTVPKKEINVLHPYLGNGFECGGSIKEIYGVLLRIY